MADTTQYKNNINADVLNSIANSRSFSTVKSVKMQSRMKNAFKQLKQNQAKLLKRDDELVDAKRQIKAWQENYVKVFNLASVGYFTVYQDLIVKEVNNFACEMLGYDRFDIIAQPFVVYASPFQRDAVRNYFSGIFQNQNQNQNQQSSGRIETTVVTSSGEHLPVIIHSVMIEQQESSNPCCLCAVIDVSQIRELEQSLEEQLENHQQDLENYQNETAAVQQRHHQQIIELNQQVEEQIKQEVAAEALKFQQDKEHLEATIAGKSAEVSEFAEKTDQLKQQIQQLTSQRDEYAEKVSELENVVSLQLTELAETRAKLDSAGEQINELEKIREDYSLLQQKMAEDDSQRQAQIQVLQQQNKEIKHKSDLEKQKLVVMVKQRARKISELRERIENAKLRYAGEISELTEKLNDTERVLGSRVSELTLINQKLQGQISSARDEANVYRKRAERTDKLLTQSQAELRAAKKEIEFRTKKIDQVQAKARKEQDGLVVKLRDKSDELDMLRQVCRQNDEDIKKLTGKLGLARAEVKAKNAQSDMLKQRLEQSRVVMQKLCDVGCITMSVYHLAEHKNVYINESIGQMLGYSPEQIEEFGDNIVKKLMHPDDIERIGKDLKDFSWDKTDEIVQLEYRLMDADGNWRYIHSNELILSTDADGKATEILTIQYDFTEKVRSKEAMKALAKIVTMVGKDSLKN